MTTEDFVGVFLSQFKNKMRIWGVFFQDDRSKNTQALADLEITPNARIEILSKLKIQDYSEGPKKDAFGTSADIWVFGTIVKEKEIYIKITMGQPGNEVICISFHPAEYKMNYPFKKD